MPTRRTAGHGHLARSAHRAHSARPPSATSPRITYPRTTLRTSVTATRRSLTRLLIAVALTAQRRARALTDRLADPRRQMAGDRGQATTEYALVLLAAALVALLVVGWATAGGGAARISALFNRVIDAVIDRV